MKAPTFLKMNRKNDFFAFFKPLKADIKTKLLLLSGVITLLLGLYTGIKKVMKISAEGDQFYSMFTNTDVLFYINLILFSLLCIWVLFWKDPKDVFYDIKEFHDFENAKPSQSISFIDFISNQRDLETKFKRANSRVDSFIRYFKFIWFSWFLLYLFMLLFKTTYMKDQLSMGEDLIFQAKSILINFANNAASLFFVFCMLVLNNITSQDERESLKLKIDAKWIFLIVAPLLLEIVCYNLVDSTDLLETNESVSQAFGVMSGLMAMIVMSLIIGRLDSKLIHKVPNGVLIVLYGYAGIQLYLPYFLEGTDVLSNRVIAVMYLALFCKIILLSFVFWIVKTNRLFFYFLAVYGIHNNIYNKWNEIRNAFVSKSKISNENYLLGKWNVYESYFSRKDFGGLITGVLNIENSFKGGYNGTVQLKDRLKSQNPEIENKFYEVSQIIEAKIMMDGNIEFRGITATITYVSNLKIDKYHPDIWKGIPIDENTIVGSSIDENGTVGHFCFKRVIDDKE